MTASATRLTVPLGTRRTRLDRWLAFSMPDLSRARIQTLIREGHVLLDGRSVSPDTRVREGQVATLQVPELVPPELTPESIPLEILFEDKHLLVLNKPAGLVVHPAAGHATGTLVNALLHHCNDLPGINGELRPGIVHRLDKDTSGVMLVAKSEVAMRGLMTQFKAGSISKTYLAIVKGRPNPPKGRLTSLIGRDPKHRQRMAVLTHGGREAITEYETINTFDGGALLSIRILTGRTHQIRVHMRHLGHPVLGDTLYGGSSRQASSALPRPARQMLHASCITFTHPVSRKERTFEAPLPADMEEFLAAVGDSKIGRPTHG